MDRGRREGESNPLTLGHALAGKARLIVWCKACQHKVEPDIAREVERCGEALSVIDWAKRLRCSACGERAADFVVTGARR